MTDSIQGIAGAGPRRRCTSLYCGPDRRTAVYRLYDRDERLLYAGITYDLEERWSKHARTKTWWSQVRHRTAVWHQTRLSAAIEEHCAIRYENPMYNLARQHDDRLGLEVTDASGAHVPRPWRLSLLKAARETQSVVEIEETRPHHPVVISSERDAFTDYGLYMIWFPRILELCEVSAPTSGLPILELGVYDRAAEAISKHLGLGRSEFTLSIHHQDQCETPSSAMFEARFPWVFLDDEAFEAYMDELAPRWQKRLKAGWARVKNASFA